MRQTAAAAALLLLTLVTSAPRSQTRADIPVRWEGTATTTHTFQPGVEFRDPAWGGRLRDARQVRVRAKESRRIDVTDQGRLVGQFVWLTDDGTSWTGTVDTTENLLVSTRFIGNASGQGGAMVFGLVFHALADPNPLADVLPNGSYCLYAPLPMIAYTQTLRDPGRRDEVSRAQSGGQLLMGDCRMLRRIAMTEPAPTVDTVRAALAAPPVHGEEFQFEGRRALQNGVMQGSSTRTNPQSPGVSMEASWTIRRRLAIDATLEGPSAAWRPVFLGDRAEVRASLNPSQQVTGKFRFTLYNVSREPGMALNEGTGTGLDLKFADDQPIKYSAPVQTGDGWTIETAEGVADATVRITALDYGAWGRIKAEVNVDGEWYDCVAANGKASVTVPVDENENHIWDTWERNTGVWGQAPASDDDNEPAGASNGDGFSNYEEYRGFKVGSDWITTGPRTKELFVFDEVGEGIGFFGKSGLVTFLIDEHQYRTSDRVVNFNAGHATRGPQKGLYLVAEALDPGTMGQVFPSVGTPNTVERVAIDTFELALIADADATPSVIAHELGHAVNVPHHGDYRQTACRTTGIIAVWRGAHGGDRGCVMTYANASHYIAWDKRCYEYTWPDQFGTGFCTSRTGTGFNTGPQRMEDGHPMPVSGDASAGNCQSALRLR